MNLVLKTSLKNIFGKPLRTLLVLFSIFICSICALVSFEFAASLKELISGSSIGLSKADGILSASDYSVKGLPEGFPESRILEISNKPENLYKDIEGEYAYVTFERLSVYGMDVKTAVDMDFIEPVEIGLNEAVITTKFAKDYGYKVGDKLMLHDTDNNEVEVTIIGISANERKNPFISNYSAFINEETSENLARGNRKINLVVIDILDNSKAQAAFKNLQEYYPKAIFMNLLADEDMLKQIDEFARFFYMIFAVTFLLVIFVTASICNRIVSERMPFVGTLRSLGMSSARTARILLLENILYALLGCVPAIVIYGILRIPILTFLGGAGSSGSSFKTTIPPMSVGIIICVVLGAIIIECMIPLKAIFKALKTSIRDIIFDNRDTAYKFSKSGLVIGIVFAVTSIVLAFFRGNFTATIICLLLSVTSIALLFPWIFKGITSLVGKIAEKKENSKWMLASVEAISRKSTVGSGVLCVTAAAMSVIIFNYVQSEMEMFVKDDYRSDVIVECTKKEENYRFARNLEGVTDVELVYKKSSEVSLNDIQEEEYPMYSFYALPDGGFKYFNVYEGLPEKLEDGSIVVDNKLAAKKGINVGDTLKLAYNPEGVLPIIREYKVVATYVNEGISSADTFFISEHDFKEVFRGSVGYCLIKCDNPDYVKRMIRTYASGYYSKLQTHDEMIQEQNDKNLKLNAAMIAIILVAVGMTFIGMASNQLIGFEGRRKECAVLLSTAMNRTKLSGVLFREMLITAFSASIIGTLVGVLMTLLINGLVSSSQELDLSVEVNPIATILFCVFLIIAFTGTVLFPIRHLKKMKIAEQIKYE